MIFSQLLQVRLPQSQTGLQNWKGTGNGSGELLFWPQGAHSPFFGQQNTLIFFGESALDMNQAWPHSTSCPAGCSVWLGCTLTDPGSSQGAMLMLASDWKLPCKQSLPEMKQHRDRERLSPGNFTRAGEFSLSLEF